MAMMHIHIDKSKQKRGFFAAKAAKKLIHEIISSSEHKASRQRQSVFLNVRLCPQLYFVYWDMSRCLRTLTETLEEGSFVDGDIQVRPFVPPHLNSSTCRTASQLKSHLVQKKLKKKLSHLMLVSDVSTPATADPNTGHGSDEERPLLSNEEPPGCSTSSEQQDNSKVPCNHSLIPDSSLSAQVQRRPRWMKF